MKLHASDKNGYICTSTKYKTKKEFKNKLIEEMKKNNFVSYAITPGEKEKKQIDIKTLKIKKD